MAESSQFGVAPGNHAPPHHLLCHPNHHLLPERPGGCAWWVWPSHLTPSLLSLIPFPLQIRITPSINSDNETFYEVRCERHILTTFLIPDILLLSAFLYGLYIFRWAQTEQLSTLTEAVSLEGLVASLSSIILSPFPSHLLSVQVFLALMARNGRYSHRRLTLSLQ